MQVRRANSRDAETLARMTQEASREVGIATVLDADRLKAHAFGPHPLIECYLVEARPGKAVAHAILTKGYDFRRASATLEVGDLYVMPEHRRDGVARILIAAIARRAIELGSREITITTGVGDAVARKFFAAIGAQESQALVYQMTGDGIEWLAAETR